uniref:hypothetical protein n=1 Tax=Kitasatospora sp. NBC_01519 TaxID=2903576 RepID=UPI002F90B081
MKEGLDDGRGGKDQHLRVLREVPLEALACGISVVVPRWDGFPCFIGRGAGRLAHVEYLSQPQGNPYEFARMNDGHFAEVCRRVLDRKQPGVHVRTPADSRTRSAMICFDVAGHDPADIVAALELLTGLGHVFGRDQSARFTFATGPDPVDRCA